MPYIRYNYEEQFDWYDETSDESDWDDDDEEYDQYLENNDTLGDPVYDYMDEEWQEYINSAAYVATEYLESVGVPTFIIDEIIEQAELQFYY